MKSATKALCLLLALSALASVQVARSPIGASTGFQCALGTGESFGVYTDHAQYVQITVLSGVLNTTTGTYLVSADGQGTLRFTNNATVTLRIDFTVDRVRVAGDSGNPLRDIASGTQIQGVASNTISVVWDSVLEPFLPVFFILGVLGMVLIPSGCIYMFKDGSRFAQWSPENIRTGVIMIALGVGFILTWVYA